MPDDDLNLDLNAPTDPIEPDPVDDPEPADDDPEPEHVDDDPADPPAPVVAPADPEQQSRARGRIQRIQDERRVAEDAAATARAEAALLRQQLAEAQRVRQEAEDATLDPDERWRRAANAQLQQMQFQSVDAADRSSYLMKAQANPVYAQYSDRVEKMLKEARAQGINPEREAVLFRLLGQDSLARMAKAPAVKKAAAARVDAARGASPGIKSNVAQTKSSTSLAERLKDIPL